MPHNLTPDPAGNLTPIAPDGADPLTAASAEAFLQRLADKDAWMELALRTYWWGSFATTSTDALDPLTLVAGASYSPFGSWSLGDTDRALIPPFAGLYSVQIRAQFTTVSNVTLQLNRGAVRLGGAFGIATGSLAVATGYAIGALSDPTFPLRVLAIGATLAPASESEIHDAHDLLVRYVGPFST